MDGVYSPEQLNDAALDGPIPTVWRERDNGYPLGWHVEHDGRMYEATEPGVTAEPGGQPGWRLTEDEPIPYWRPGPYETGAVVRDRLHVYECLMDVDGMPPSIHIAAWRRID